MLVVGILLVLVACVWGEDFSRSQPSDPLAGRNCRILTGAAWNKMGLNSL